MGCAAIVLRVCYAAPRTEIGYAATRLLRAKSRGTEPTISSSRCAKSNAKAGVPGWHRVWAAKSKAILVQRVLKRRVFAFDSAVPGAGRCAAEQGLGRGAHRAPAHRGEVLGAWGAGSGQQHGTDPPQPGFSKAVVAAVHTSGLSTSIGARRLAYSDPELAQNWPNSRDVAPFGFHSTVKGMNSEVPTEVGSQGSQPRTRRTQVVSGPGRRIQTPTA
eukprot:143477-Rhodomonas_salina.1